MPECDGCGVSYEDTIRLCPYCGRENTKPLVSTPVDQGFLPMACPVCLRADKVASVSGIRLSQTQQVTGSTPVSNTHTDKDGKTHSSVSYANFSGTQITNLAKELTPPSKPTKPSKHGCGTWFLFFLIIGMIGQLFYIVANNEGKLLEICILIILIGLFFWWLATYIKVENMYPANLEKFEKDIINWEKAIVNWDHLYYCSRDNCVFIPGRNSYAPITKMLDYIYERTPHL